MQNERPQRLKPQKSEKLFNWTLAIHFWGGNSVRLSGPQTDMQVQAGACTMYIKKGMCFNSEPDMPTK